MSLFQGVKVFVVGYWVCGLAGEKGFPIGSDCCCHEFGVFAACVLWGSDWVHCVSPVCMKDFLYPVSGSFGFEGAMEGCAACVVLFASVVGDVFE